MAYVKLFGSILASTVWAEPSDTRVVWITMLAMADRDGEVMASIPGLAHISRVTDEACTKAISVLLAPDQDSRSKNDEGRRIRPIDGGWQIINYEKHRDRFSLEDRRERERLRQKRFRDRNALSRSVTQCNDGHAVSREIAHADQAQIRLRSGSDQREESTPPPPLEQPERPERPKRPKRVKVVLGSADCPEGTEQETWDSYLALRRAKRLPLTTKALALLAKSGSEIGYNLQQVLVECIERNWAGFQAKWIMAEIDRELAEEAKNKRAMDPPGRNHR